MRKFIFVNTITSVRLLSVPVVIYSIAIGNWLIAAPVLLIGVITDLLDGYLARRWRVGSHFGYVFDKQSDRILVASTLVGLFLAGELPLPIASMLIISVWLQDVFTKHFTAIWCSWWRPACYSMVTICFISHLTPITVVVTLGLVVILLALLRATKAEELTTLHQKAHHWLSV